MWLISVNTSSISLHQPYNSFIDNSSIIALVAFVSKLPPDGFNHSCPITATRRPINSRCVITPRKIPSRRAFFPFRHTCQSHALPSVPPPSSPSLSPHSCRTLCCYRRLPWASSICVRLPLVPSHRSCVQQQPSSSLPQLIRRLLCQGTQPEHTNDAILGRARIQKRAYTVKHSTNIEPLLNRHHTVG